MRGGEVTSAVVSHGRGRCAPGSAAGGAARWTAVVRMFGTATDTCAVSFVIRQGCGGPADQDPRVRMGLRWTGPILCRAGEGLGDWERPFDLFASLLIGACGRSATDAKQCASTAWHHGYSRIMLSRRRPSPAPRLKAAVPFEATG